jgi:hypothetical protein
MSNWQHKAADELASAVANHIKYVHDDLANTAQLIGIYKAAKRAATVPETGPEALIHIRGILCYACRRHKSYPCDLDSGWSPNCAFIRANSHPQTARESANHALAP